MKDADLLAIVHSTPELKAGDRVVLLSGGMRFPLHGFRDDNTYTVRTPKYTHSSGHRVEIMKPNGGGIGYATHEQLQKVVDES